MNRYLIVSCWLVLIALGGASSRADQYDPLAVPKGFQAKTIDLTIDDADRKREIPIKAYLPAAEPLTPGPSPARGEGSKTKAAPVVLFSHGLGGSREASPYLGNHWAARGFVCVFLQHPGSDSSVWQGKALGSRMTAMRDAAGPANFLLRVKDVPAVIDQLETWNKTAGHELFGRLDLEHLGMSGHSFGAVTTQAVSGQSYGGGRLAPPTDKRIDAAVMFSPSAARSGVEPSAAFGEVKIPWLLMTGTNDDSPIGGQTPESRLDVFPGLPPGSKYELVLDGAEHSAFSERGSPLDKTKPNPNHHRAILAVSTAFWEAYLRDDAAAKAWLDGAGARTVLEKADRWQMK
ncbi:MAG: dienelactone hydrolase [Planctomycetales bacterium]|nr:dienelactone hydrolase [Planctomycetales bacterium]